MDSLSKNQVEYKNMMEEIISSILTDTRTIFVEFVNIEGSEVEK